MANSMLNMLLNLPEKMTSRTVSVPRSHQCGHRLAAEARNSEVLKAGMFMMKMPSSAKPRIASSTSMRSPAEPEQPGSSLRVS